MLKWAKYFGALALIAAGSIVAVPGCTMDVTDSEPGEEEADPEAFSVEEPALDPQGPQFCCYADCANTPGTVWKYVGQPPFSKCKQAAKWYCQGKGTTLEKHDWRPCP